jgi:hypothetical protein
MQAIAEDKDAQSPAGPPIGEPAPVQTGLGTSHVPAAADAPVDTAPPSAGQRSARKSHRQSQGAFLAAQAARASGEPLLLLSNPCTVHLSWHIIKTMSWARTCLRVPVQCRLRVLGLLFRKLIVPSASKVGRDTDL